MSKALETASLGPHLPAVYRFAFLMTGGNVAAAAVLRHTVERAARDGIPDLRDVRRVKRWLFTEARRQCAQIVPPPVLAVDGETIPDDPPESPLAARFARVPETERGALILFYLYLFDPGELTEVLEIAPGELAPLLIRGRELLGASETG